MSAFRRFAPLLATSACLRGYRSSISVTNLDAIDEQHGRLLPPAKRATRFPVSDVAFDPAGLCVGGPLPGGRTTGFRVKDKAGREIHGNSNIGHDYGNEAIEKQPGTIETLIAYVKTL